MSRERKASDVLIAAASLISDEGRWSNQFLAESAGGAACANANDEMAARWCSIGAIDRLLGVSRIHGAMSMIRDWTSSPYFFLDAAWFELGFGNAATGNDQSDHATVLERFDRAAKLAKEAGL